MNERVWHTLRELAAFEPSLLKTLVASFLETSERRLDQLDAGDGDVEEIAHAFRGAALQVGADALAGACENLELEPERRETLSPVIRRAFERARIALLEQI